MEFTVTLRYKLAAHDANHDALVGSGRDGYLALEFLREADSMEMP